MLSRAQSDRKNQWQLSLGQNNNNYKYWKARPMVTYQ